MLKEIMKNTIEYVNSFPKKERKSYGQFFTPMQMPGSEAVVKKYW